MKLIVNHFLKHHRLHKIFNMNTIKLSYSCMKNMGNIITKYNNKLLFQSFQQLTQMCNCRDKASCPMEGNCLPKCFVYRHKQTAEVRESTTYFGTSEDKFKTAYNNHTISFQNKGREKKTELCLGNMFGN